MAARHDEPTSSNFQTARLLDGDEVQGVLSGAFYARPTRESGPHKKQDATDKNAHCMVICISISTKDLERLDGMVDALKTKGMTRASRSALIRAALDQVDLEQIPRGP